MSRTIAGGASRTSAGGASRTIACDSPEWRFAVGEIEALPDGAWLARVREHGDRKRENLARVADGAIEPLLDATARSAANVLAGSIDARGFLFVSDETGTGELWRFDAHARKATKLTSFAMEIASAVSLDADRALLLLRHPATTDVVVVSSRTGEVVHRESLGTNAEVLDARDDRAYVVHDGAGEAESVDEWIFATASSGALSRATVPRFGPPVAVKGALEACDAEYVTIPTFDRDLHAWLLTPTKAAPAGDRFALVRAFYGGENVFDVNDQIVCAAGGAVLSPAIRGSSGQGSAFAALNDGDMGGDEVYDLFASGRWLAQRLGLEPARIGLIGGSHGGYEVLRALTFPERGVNGRALPRFAFGFGLSHSGISDLEALASTTRIPDWLAREAGTDATRLRDRSPIRHVDALRAPVFLSYGSADTRVPPSQSVLFAKAARAAGKDVTTYELARQGHHVEGIATERALWAARFAFLARVLPK